MDEFEVVSRDGLTLVIRHRTKGHELTYRMMEHDDGHREMRLLDYRDGAGPHGSMHVLSSANQFASTEAKRAGMFD